MLRKAQGTRGGAPLQQLQPSRWSGGRQLLTQQPGIWRQRPAAPEIACPPAPGEQEQKSGGEEVRASCSWSLNVRRLADDGSSDLGEDFNEVSQHVAETV